MQEDVARQRLDVKPQTKLTQNKGRTDLQTNKKIRDKTNSNKQHGTEQRKTWRIYTEGGDTKQGSGVNRK